MEKNKKKWIKNSIKITNLSYYYLKNIELLCSRALESNSNIVILKLINKNIIIINSQQY